MDPLGRNLNLTAYVMIKLNPTEGIPGQRQPYITCMYHWNNIHDVQGNTERRGHYIGKDRFALFLAPPTAARRRSGVANYRGNYAPRRGRKGRDKVVFEATKT